MIKKFLFSLSLTISFTFSVLCQNYELLKPNVNYFYDGKGVKILENYESQFIGIKIEEWSDSSGIKRFAFPKMLRQSSYLPCLNDSWWGNEMLKSSSGEYLLLNKDLDSVLIYSMSILNDSWQLLKFSNGNYISAIVDAHNEQSFLGVTDSVKTINLQLLNSTGDSVPHPINGKKIKLSKNYGAIQVFDWYNFPDNPNELLIKGISDPPAGIQNLTAKEVYDFEIGDEFHYFEEWRAWIKNWGKTYSRYVVTNKYTSQDQDTVGYNFNQLFYIEKHFENNHDTIISTKNSGNTYVLSNLEQFDKLPFEIIQNNGHGFYLFYENNNRLLKYFEDHYFLDSNCIMLPTGTGIYGTHTYAKGTGLFLYSNMDGNNDKIVKLVYYKKGSETWGTPIDFGKLTSFKPKKDSNFQIKVFPNPAKDYFYIELQEYENATVEFLDVSGKILFTVNIKGNSNKIIIPEGYKGMYLLKIISENEYVSYRNLLVY
jgi:hypothetical protein